MEDHVPRHAQMGAWVLINDRWYNFIGRLTMKRNPIVAARIERMKEIATTELAIVP